MKPSKIQYYISVDFYHNIWGLRYWDLVGPAQPEVGTVVISQTEHTKLSLCFSIPSKKTVLTSTPPIIGFN